VTGFWANVLGLDSNGELDGWFEAQPVSCINDQSTCPDAPIVQNQYRNGEWRPTTKLALSALDSFDGRIAVKATAGDGNAFKVVVDGRTVATAATDIAKTRE
jgi:hypothetical protein